MYKFIMVGLLFLSISRHIFADLPQDNPISCEAIDFLSPKEVRKYYEFKNLSQFHGLAIYKVTGIPENEELTISRYRHCEDRGFIELDKLKGSDGEGIIMISSEGFIPGEKATFRLTRSDGMIVEETTLIPCPIQVKSKSGRYSIKAELDSLNPPLYVIDISGLKEGELFYFSPKSDIQMSSFSPKVMYCPWQMKGSKGGYETLTFTFDREKIQLKLPYGDKLLSFSQSGDIYTP